MTPYVRFAMMAAAIAALAFIAPQWAQSATSYPLVCRGGGAMAFELRHTDDFSAVVVHFNRGTQPANTVAPAVGECSWLDRPVGADEPDMLAARFAGVSIYPNIQANGSLQDLAFFSAVGDSGAGQRSRQAQDLINAIRNGQPFQVQAAQGSLVGYRLLVVSQLGP